MKNLLKAVNVCKNIFHNLPLGLTATLKLGYCTVGSIITEKESCLTVMLRLLSVSVLWFYPRKFLCLKNLIFIGGNNSFFKSSLYECGQ